MKVRILKAFGQFTAGQVIPEMPNNQARELIGRGLVEEVKAEPYVAPVNRAMPSAPAQRKPTLKLRS
jgi:hypothetical protein